MKVDQPFLEAMRHATHLIRTQGPRAATQFIQGLFRSGAPTARPGAAPVGDRADEHLAQFEDAHGPIAKLERCAADAPAELLSEGGQFLSGRFSNEAGARNYKLYVPAGYVGAPLPLVVMLHGCTQDPDDFATGTRANRWADNRRCLVAYPEQTQRANSHRCWNWFRPQDQGPGRGEPAIIAGITKQVIDEYQIDERRVYVAGLSAGGAMAAIVGQAYPELFAAIGVHSGVLVGAAHDLPSAFALMKTGQPRPAPHAMGQRARSSSTHSSRRVVPLIVLHGDADRTVNPANAKRLIENAVATHHSMSAGSRLQVSLQTVGETYDCHGYRRTKHTAANGASMIEQWEIRGAGHAWSGGDAAGSYTSGRGPDATKVMLDFFDQHVAPDEETAPQVMDSAA